ncbi:hypothetical protein [Zunongwangia endophytica]|uniref:Uncharacterized protein n=1 Tax=Zunongwangia endophytica TaxID=1808945 RepID=A0ABV8H5T5_9FLAO|nr:hypothetical protein [Zunongwangia endophytica]MDN3595303.1 hypothetical protein [Zunongwangia endophytica]
MKPHIKIWDVPQNGHIEDDHYGVTFDYFYMGQRVAGGQIHNRKKQPKSKLVELLIYIEVIDHLDKQFIRKEKSIVLRSTVKFHIEERIKNFMRDLDVSPVFIRGLMRDFGVSTDKCKEWDQFEFDRF